MEAAKVGDTQTAVEDERSASRPDHEVFDIAIVGMGPAGLYTGWRLSKAVKVFGYPVSKLRVALYDTMPPNMVGGRLCTQPLPGYPFLAELGGMRFRDNQLLVSGLIDALGLSRQIKRFDFDQHFYFLREKRLLENQFMNNSTLKLPYTLNEEEKGRLPHQLIEFVIHKILESLKLSAWDNLPQSEKDKWGIDYDQLIKRLKSLKGLGKLGPREWAVVERFGYYHRNYLYDVGFWDLLQSELSPGAWHMALDGLGYASIMGNWNAAIALPWFLNDFATLNFRTLKNGMKSITSRLYEEIQKRPNFSVYHNHDLTEIDLHGDTQGSESLLRLRFNIDGNLKPQDRFAKSVVLALPKGALIRLNYTDGLMAKSYTPEGLIKRSWFFDQLNSVEGKPLFKLFLGYASPWWTETKWWKKNRTKSSVVHGKVNTDLPLRQVYYYSKDQWNEDRKKALGISPGREHHSMLMASYSDSHYIEFWTETARKEDRWPYTRLRVGQRLPEDLDVLYKFGAPLSMILRAEHQLGLLHGERIERDVSPRAEVGLYMEWSRPPYYAGWHSWKVGVKPWEVCRYLMQPFEGVKVFICGEAYSNEQGWVEGALKSAERLLTQKFLLPPPSEILKVKFDGDREKLYDYIDAFDQQDLTKRASRHSR